MRVDDNNHSSPAIMAFSSAKDLLDRINEGECSQTKAVDEILPANLFSRYSEIDIENDPLLAFEVSRGVCKENGTLYKILGYDELVPNENFARLLNIHGEIQVGETVYKISPRGTYFFPASEIELFESKYPELEGLDGETIAEKTQHLVGAIYRYDTFFGLNNEMWADDVQTRAIDTHVGSADEVFNNQLFYHAMSSDRRMKTRVYNHDYVVYQERGAYVKIQKKAWLGWSDITASELGLSWNNIIMTRSYDGNNGKPLPGMNPVVLSPTTVTFNGQTHNVFEIKAYSIPESYYDTIARGNASTVRSKILADTGIDIIGYDIIRLYGFDYIQLIFLPDIVTRTNVDEVKVEFSNNVMGVCYRFAAGQFFYAGRDNTLTGQMRVGTAF